MNSIRLGISTGVFILAFLLTLAVVAYFGWAVSLSGPVDWAQLTTFAFVCGPVVGGFAAAMVWALWPES